jgi:hypothetical protein
MAASPPLTPMEGLLAHPSPTRKGPNMLPDEPIREHPDIPGDPYMGTDGGGGKRDRCKNLMVEEIRARAPLSQTTAPSSQTSPR